MTPTMSVPTARTVLATDPKARVLDVRTPGEFVSAHIDGAINFPLDELVARLPRLAVPEVAPLVLVCQSGARAARAQAALAEAGAAGAVVLEGGMNAWAADAAPVTAGGGKARWSLERQVRLVAGGIVATSILASVRWPRARFVAGFIGAGLTFAAVTNTCAMGMALAKLPYNRGPRFDADTAVARLNGAPVV
ncbi:rhodanese-like domain-containing protein [Sinosporangium siamense]|uniref:Sulfurtransferase n=1 Tax=Sinosporangium siamense TaxID=1367973 RepID=A0A919RQS0_9ACTN|nr:rhodanese-like domain-containing protein [Sinosporangium siamense]GII97340.1 sulfurtransferase [Sinosporangium siamense]